MVELVQGFEARKIAHKLLPQLYVREELWDYVVPGGMGVYYKVWRDEKTGDYAVLYLYTWDKQIIPPHRYDYEPVIVIADKNLKVKEVYTDGFHYYIRRFKPMLGRATRTYLVIDNSWRSMRAYFARRALPHDVVEVSTGELGGLSPLTNYKLREMKSREVNPLSINEEILENPFTVRRAEHWSTLHAPEPTDLWLDLAKNVGLRAVVDRMIESAREFLYEIGERVSERWLVHL